MYFLYVSRSRNFVLANFWGVFPPQKRRFFQMGGQMSELRSKCQNWGAERNEDWGYCNEIIYAMIIDHLMLRLRSKCYNRGVNVRIEVYCASLLFWWSLIIAYIQIPCFHYKSCSALNPGNPALNSGKVRKGVKNDQFWRPNKWVRVPIFFLLPWIHIGMGFMQKTGSKLVKFCFCGPIYILHPPIGGSHPVPCLTTQITERRGTAMY